jgi:hypothetical protein
MKIVIGFIAGTIAGLIITIFAFNCALPAKAEESEDLSSLLPDIQKIYRESLTAPFQQVESEIYDPEIAGFYNTLMQKTGLSEYTCEQ